MPQKTTAAALAQQIFWPLALMACVVLSTAPAAAAAASAAAPAQALEPALRPLPKRPRPKGPPRPPRAEPPTRHWIFEDSSAHRRPQQLSFMLGSAFDSLSLGIWYGVPIVVQGPLQEVNNSVYLEFGLLGSSDLHSDGYLTLSAGARWNFYLTTRWALFAALRANFNLGPWRATQPFFVLPGASLGAHYRLSRATRLRLELGYPIGLGIGISLQF